ncbi:hypothetical protein L3Q72_22990 [Vibrio sp. JC009]|uniref:hypothetical protein n=1 Tax=Vibrio sp. JC009 TaxID=2912314 RepID=UPI0023B10C5C|nr:hypothetical protein [Vibrio sp. JC009]WED24099.1 hypothetical protein L3Q72_22990 [Vibrio sp. JC009]
MINARNCLTAVGLVALFSAGGVQASSEGTISQQKATQTVTINSVDFKVADYYDFFTWETLPSDVLYEKEPLQTFTNTNGDKHYYHVVYLPNGNLNWFQAAKLAEEAGGYLASITSEAENNFLFNLIDDPKYFFQFPKYVEGSGRANHYEIMIGPMLGGYQPEDATIPDADWHWLSGEEWSYTNWAQNLDDGVIDKDPRNNTQPNDSGKEKSQRILGFGELNQPVPTWGDYSDDAGTYGRRGPGRYAFIIEYNSKPE